MTRAMDLVRTKRRKRWSVKECGGMPASKQDKPVASPRNATGRNYKRGWSGGRKRRGKRVGGEAFQMISSIAAPGRRTGGKGCLTGCRNRRALAGKGSRAAAAALTLTNSRPRCVCARVHRRSKRPSAKRCQGRGPMANKSPGELVSPCLLLAPSWSHSVPGRPGSGQTGGLAGDLDARPWPPDAGPGGEAAEALERDAVGPAEMRLALPPAAPYCPTVHSPGCTSGR